MLPPTSQRTRRSCRTTTITRKVSSEIWIKDTNQREPLRRGRRPRETPVARVEHLLEPVRLAGAAPDGDRAADEVPRHVMEKAIRREEHGDPVAAPDDVQCPYVAHGILRPPGRRTEGAEVAAPAQRDERPAHRRDVESPGHMPRVAREERVRDRGVFDEVDVALAECCAARVEPGRAPP